MIVINLFSLAYTSKMISVAPDGLSDLHLSYNIIIVFSRYRGNMAKKTYYIIIFSTF